MSVQTIISIQSCVSYGHVGNSAITFPLQRLGVRVWPIHTVVFSNHTGYGQWRGKILELSTVQEVFQGIKDRGHLAACNALLTGYMGSVELGNTMISALEEIRKENPDCFYCMDPVMGDIDRGFFVKEGIPEFFKNDLIKHASLITPNHFELEYLVGQKISTLQQAIKASLKLIANTNRIVLTTSLVLKNDQNNIHVLAVNGKHAYLITTPKIPISLNGTGDLTAAFFTYFYLKTKKLDQALEETVNRLFVLIKDTHENHERELRLVENQDSIVNCELKFKAKSL